MKTDTRTIDAMRHVGLELAAMSRQYDNEAFVAEGAGGLHAELHASFLRLIRDNYHALEVFLLEKVDRMLEEDE